MYVYIYAHTHTHTHTHTHLYMHTSFFLPEYFEHTWSQSSHFELVDSFPAYVQARRVPLWRIPRPRTQRLQQGCSCVSIYTFVPVKQLNWPICTRKASQLTQSLQEGLCSAFCVSICTCQPVKPVKWVPHPIKQMSGAFWASVWDKIVVRRWFRKRIWELE